MQNRTQSLLRHTRIPSLETCGLALLCLFYVRLVATAMMSFELIPSGGGEPHSDYCKWWRGRRCYSLCYGIRLRLDVPVFSDKDDKPQAPSPASSLHWLRGDVKESTFCLKRVGNVGLAKFPKVLKLGAPAKFPFQNCKLLNAVWP